MKQINFALIGSSGYWAQNIRSTLLKLGLPLVRTCDLVGDGLDGIPHSNNLKDVLMDDVVDAVLICTPPSTHFSIAKQCLEAKKHVFCEKPLCLNKKDAAKLCKIVTDFQNRVEDRVSLILMVDKTFTFSPEIRFIKDSLTLHRFGTPNIVRSERTNYGPFSKDVNVIWDLMVHDVAILDTLFGTGKYVTATGSWLVNNGIYDDCRATFTYRESCKNTLKADIHVSWLSQNKVRKFEIVTDKGFLTTTFNGAVQFKKNSGEIENFIMADKSSPLEVELNHFHEAILNNFQPLSNGGNGYYIVEILEKVEESVKYCGREVAL